MALEDNIMKLIISNVRAAFVVVVVVLALSLPAVAQNEGQSLASQANDPTASLMSFQFQNYYSPNLHNTPGTSNVAQFRAAIPFQLWGMNHIARLTLPYVTKSANGRTGMSDATLFDLVTFDRSWGRFGVGAVALLPTGSDAVSAEKKMGDWPRHRVHGTPKVGPDRSVQSKPVYRCWR